jgi:hypothetical protein
MEQILGFLQPLLEIYAGSQGWLVAVIAYIGSARAFIKPLMSVARAYVDFTKSDKDNIQLDKVESSKVYTGILYAIDWLTSIKFKK